MSEQGQESAPICDACSRRMVSHVDPEGFEVWWCENGHPPVWREREIEFPGEELYFGSKPIKEVSDSLVIVLLYGADPDKLLPGVAELMHEAARRLEGYQRRDD